MASNEESVSRILVVLSHPLRRQILMSLEEKGEYSFTDLMNTLHTDTGKLSFHIRNLNAFVEQTPTGKYRLNKTGENAIRLLRDLEAWAVEVPSVKGGSSLPLATIGKRVQAFLIDFAIAIAVYLASSLPSLLPNLTSNLASNLGRLFSASTVLFSLALFWVYFTLLEGFVGQSLGKRAVGLMVVRVDGKKLFYDHAAVRNFGKVFLLPFDLFFGYRLKDERFIRYFDKFAGTMVRDLRA